MSLPSSAPVPAIVAPGSASASAGEEPPAAGAPRPSRAEAVAEARRLDPVLLTALDSTRETRDFLLALEARAAAFVAGVPPAPELLAQRARHEEL